MDKVLIVEDNPVLLKILETGLKKYENKFISITAKDGQEAIDILQSTQIALLVTDLQMPKVDGLSLLAYMNDHHPEIQCIVMSAHGTPQLKEKISLDVLRFIEKPFEIEELVQTILPTLERDEPAGHLNGISISNFLQMIHMERKTCLLEVETPDGKKGYIYFEDGVLFDAVYGDQTGEAAALEIIPHDRVKIRFKNLARGKKKVNRRIQKDLAAVLMDSMRRKDEAEVVPPSEEDSLLDNIGDLAEDFELLDRDDDLDSEVGEDAAADVSVELTAEVDSDLALDDDDEVDAVIDLKEEVESDIAFDDDDEGDAMIDLKEEVEADIALDDGKDTDSAVGLKVELDSSDFALDEEDTPDEDLARDDEEQADLTFALDEEETDDEDLSLDDDDMADLDFGLDEDAEITPEEPQELPAPAEAGEPEELILEVGPPGELEFGADLSDDQETPIVESVEQTETSPSPAPPKKTAADTLSRHLKELFTIGGYRASAILDAGGEVLASDTTCAETEMDLEYTAAMFSNVFQGTRKICEQTGFEDSSEMTIVSTKGIIVMRGDFQDGSIAFVIILILEPDGNQALARMSIKRMLPRIKEALG